MVSASLSILLGISFFYSFQYHANDFPRKIKTKVRLIGSFLFRKHTVCMCLPLSVCVHFETTMNVSINLITTTYALNLQIKFNSHRMGFMMERKIHDRNAFISIREYIISRASDMTEYKIYDRNSGYAMLIWAWLCVCQSAHQMEHTHDSGSVSCFIVFISFYSFYPFLACWVRCTCSFRLLNLSIISI